MKKLLLLSFVLSSSFAGAQMLQSEDFNGLSLGDVGTDFTGLTAGQGSWLTFASNGTAPTTATNAGNANFQIVADGFESTNGVKIIGSDGNKGSRFMWKDGLVTAWDTRDSGNEIFEVEYDMYTGSATTSTSQFGMRLYGLDGTTSRVLNGYVYNANTRILQGVAYLNNAGTFGTYLITLQTGGLVLDPDTWYRMGFAYDTTTGETIWKVGAVYTGLPQANWAGPFAIDELDIVQGTPTTNAAVAEIVFDNITAKATPEEALLGVNQASDVVAFSVSPNPARESFNIASANNTPITAVEMHDINGRLVKSVKVDSVSNAQLNISDLAQGIYTVTISSELGSTTKKIVKQ